MRLGVPRLLPATIVTMSALLAVKSITLVQAATEAQGAAPAETDGKAAKPADVRDAPAAPTGEAAKTMVEAGHKPEPAPDPAARPEAAAGPAVLQMSESERQVLLSLRTRREQLDAREHALAEREAEIAAANKSLVERVQQLQTLQVRLESLEAGRQQHRAENWSGLVKTYEAMKPRDAAAIFDALDMQVLLQVLDRMQERRAAPVLAAMQPDRARLVTQLLAEMRTRATAPPDQPQPTMPPKG